MEIELRPFKISDAESLAKNANNNKIAANLTDAFPHPYTIDNAKDFIQVAMKYNPPTIKAIVFNEEVIGGVGLHLQDDIYKNNAELGYWIAEEYWGKGVATKAIQHMVEYGFNTFEINRIFAKPFGRNIASQKVLEKSGFKKEAHFNKTILKNGVLEDELVFAIRKK